jgi:hypothetical protein
MFAQPAPQLVMQAVPQLPAPQVALRFGPGAGQGVHDVPQLDTLVLARHSLLHLWKSPPQVKSHAPDTQLAAAFNGSGQTRQVEPQVSVLSTTQAPPQSLKPAPHASEQLPDLHTGDALVRAFVHATQAAPQLVAFSRTQFVPHRW